MNYPVVSARKARKIDQLAIDRYGMAGLVLMENAGRGVADTICELGINGPISIVTGRGNNGGDGFVIARHLDLRGHDARLILCCEENRLRGDALTNYRIAAEAGIPMLSFDESTAAARAQIHTSDWVVDALLGTGAIGSPRPPMNGAIRVMNDASGNKLAVDLPSGLDADSGDAADPTFSADHTCTFVAAKTGLVATKAKPYVGRLHVLDIGAPRILVEEILG